MCLCMVTHVQQLQPNESKSIFYASHKTHESSIFAVALVCISADAKGHEKKVFGTAPMVHDKKKTKYQDVCRKKNPF